MLVVIWAASTSLSLCITAFCNWMLQMAQELGVIDMDPDFFNPYKKETQVVSFT